MECVDGFHVVPYDLSGLLEVPGQCKCNSVIGVISKEVLDVASWCEAVSGDHVVSTAQNLVVEKLHDRYRFRGSGADTFSVVEKCRLEVGRIKKGL